MFRTLDGGTTWIDVSGNLPDVPVNSVILDPSYSNTLYVGTDVGPFVTNNGGANWTALGTGIPPVAIWQLDLDPAHRLLAAGTHGRGAWSIKDASTVPALVLSKVDAGKPVGPSSHVDYTITLRNIGNAAATGVKITDPVPDNTSFVSAADGGTYSGGVVSWSSLTVPAGGAVSVHFTVSISDALKKKVDSIVNDGFKVTSAQGMSASGSPTVTPIAPAFALALSPATQTDGGRNGTSVTYHVAVQNNGFQPDTYALSATSTYTVHFLDAACCAAGEQRLGAVRRVGRRLRQRRRAGRGAERRGEHGDGDRDVVGQLDGHRERHRQDDRGRGRHAARRQRRQQPGRSGHLQDRPDCGRPGVQRLGPEGGQCSAGELREGVQERRTGSPATATRVRSCRTRRR